MKKMCYVLLGIMLLTSLEGCFYNKKKEENDLSRIKIIQKAGLNEVIIKDKIAAAEIEIEGIVDEKDIVVNKEFISIIKHERGNTLITVVDLETAKCDKKVFEIKCNEINIIKSKLYSDEDFNIKKNNIKKTIVTIEKGSIQLALLIDKNKDRKIDIYDLVEFVKYYNSSEADCDFNGDGQVGIYEFVYFASVYGSYIDEINDEYKLRKNNVFDFIAKESVYGIEVKIDSAIKEENITSLEDILKIVKTESDKTTVALSCKNKDEIKTDEVIFSIKESFEPLKIKTVNKVLSSKNYSIMDIHSVIWPKTQNLNYIIKNYSDWIEMFGKLSDEEIKKYDFDNYDYIAVCGKEVRVTDMGFFLTVNDNIETDKDIYISINTKFIGGPLLPGVIIPYEPGMYNSAGMGEIIRGLFKIKKSCKNINLNINSEKQNSKLYIFKNSMDITDGNISIVEEGKEGEKFPLYVVVQNEYCSNKIINLVRGRKYTISIEIPGRYLYRKVFTVENGDILINLEKMNQIADGVYFNKDNNLIKATPDEEYENFSVYNFKSGYGEKTVFWEEYKNGKAILSKGISLESNKNYQFINYKYSDSSKNRIEVFKIDDKIKMDIYIRAGKIIERRYVDRGEQLIEPYQEVENGMEFFAYTEKKGCYTERYTWKNGDKINVKTEKIEDDSLLHGKIYFGKSSYFEGYLENKMVFVSDETGKIIKTFNTDSEGKYSVDLSNGNYILSFIDSHGRKNITEIKVIGRYHDFEVICLTFTEKPNVYLYPEKTTKMSVQLEFPNGGRVVKSIPEYGTGWNDITIEPDGTINGKYGYLFYESLNMEFSQFSEGWVVERENLEKFFRKNMYDYGFRGQEIEDMIEYWIPLLNEGKYYAVYPQLKEEISKEIVLNVLKKPDSILRVIYTIKPLNTNELKIKAPIISDFTRKGFTVTEWGVIRK